MSPENILRSDALDILFENRNKLYGAYELRKRYDRRLGFGLVGMTVIAGLLMLLASWKKSPKPAIMINSYYVDTFKLIDPPKPPVVEPSKPVLPQQQAATAKNPTPVIVPDEQVDHTEIPTVDEMEGKKIGLENVEGPETGDIVQAAATSGTGTEPAPEVPPAAPDEPLKNASVMPSFPGGQEALQRWLSRNLRPQEGQEEGQRVKVVVRFVVAPSGAIDRIQLVQEGGEPYDNEVLRVVKKMPAWKPGLQDGRPVAVWFSIPVIFETGL